LKEKVTAPVWKAENTAVGIRYADHELVEAFEYVTQELENYSNQIYMKFNSEYT
jgi:hypothetical protein